MISVPRGLLIKSNNSRLFKGYYFLKSTLTYPLSLDMVHDLEATNSEFNR